MLDIDQFRVNGYEENGAVIFSFVPKVSQLPSSMDESSWKYLHYHSTRGTTRFGSSDGLIRFPTWASSDVCRESVEESHRTSTKAIF